MGAFSGGGLFGGQGLMPNSGSPLIPGMGGMNIGGTGGSSLFGTPNPGGTPFSQPGNGGTTFGSGMFPTAQTGGNGGTFGPPGLPGIPGQSSNTPLNNQGGQPQSTQGNLLGNNPATLNNILPPGFQGVTEQALNTGFLNIPQIMQGIETSSFPGFEQGMAGLSNLFGSNNASFGSEKSLGASNMSAQYASQLAGIQSQLYEQQAQNQLGVYNTLEGQEATYKANQASPWDIASGILGLGASTLGAGGMFGAYGAFGSGGGAFGSGGMFGGSSDGYGSLSGSGYTPSNFASAAG